MTVIPRGRALGVTHFLPEGDAYTRTREYFNATMTAMMGGRAAEELIFGKITNGAASDIQTRDGPGAEDGLRVGHERPAGAAPVRQEARS